MTPTLATVSAAVSGLAIRTSAAFERRRILSRLSRFSDRRLQDIGLERDWDGSILRGGRAI
ncbi:DUF1127 domain-containing protein [Mesorhizobium sp. M0152]|uniref:DUF1127 domain-containing protein n=1 Tax=unclassified Mesorhizobium TaxID=325217 RepID=UPI00333985E0